MRANATKGSCFLVSWPTLATIGMLIAVAEGSYCGCVRVLYPEGSLLLL